MTDVEKYGVFALVFVGLVLGLTLLQGAWDEDAEAAGAEDRAARPVIIRSASDVVDGRVLRPAAIQPVTLPRGGKRGDPPAKRYTVRPLTDDRGAFQWDEAPVPYGGPRSSLPAFDLPDGTKVHVVRKDETLGDISKEYFGTTTRWREFLDLNPGLDPKRLQVGQQLVVAAPNGLPTARAVAAPPPSAKAAASSTGPRTYTVRKGDTLSEIAQRQMGSAARSEELFQANRDLLKSKDQLKVGMALRIP